MQVSGDPDIVRQAAAVNLVRTPLDASTWAAHFTVAAPAEAPPSVTGGGPDMPSVEVGVAAGPLVAGGAPESAPAINGSNGDGKRAEAAVAAVTVLLVFGAPAPPPPRRATQLCAGNPMSSL